MKSYFKAVLKYAVRGFVGRTDGFQIVLASLVPAFYQIMGRPMPVETQNVVLTYIAYATFGFIIIRLITAPYFVWRDQEVKIAELKEKAEEPLRQAAIKKMERTFNLKSALSKEISKLTAAALDYSAVSQIADYWLGIQDRINDVRGRLPEIAHDQQLWDQCQDVLHLIEILISDKLNRRQNIEDRAALHEKSKVLLRSLQMD